MLKEFKIGLIDKGREMASEFAKGILELRATRIEAKILEGLAMQKASSRKLMLKGCLEDIAGTDPSDALDEKLILPELLEACNQGVE